MIARIKGRIIDKNESAVFLENAGMAYEVLLPRAVMGSVDAEFPVGTDIELFTYYYHQVDQSRAIPILIGFQNIVEKEFFEKFISVSGIGPKAACRALAEPFSQIAGAIDSGDTVFLKKLPGIGERKAAEIVARLKGKVGKYGLIQDEKYQPQAKGKEVIKDEALAVLLQLQYKKNEAIAMMENALKINPDVKNSEELLNEVYREKKVI